MTPEVMVAIFAFGGTFVGTVGGIVASSKLTNFRLKQLEKKVDQHNTVIERTYKLEEQVKAVCGRVNGLERRVE